ncbi:LOG family protein [Paeniglutamicibacter cryotolerans]|uniref:Putative Rossmann-fold nucleotide-binding protein n=1 Tax=Paeniglutamicibacter cryotolerans TaxID=670079 RepID=A0A839QL01_9MICC|nr:Rossmann fold nucleotide-binding protein [Paeniglutamicibacter cryotolerans]MBB2995444.1 putative Rossmann-fold nucleotide-binding protein [Paeniglutamicibacter cryotolerans]
MNATPALRPMPRQVDIDSLAAFDEHARMALDRPPGKYHASMRGWHVQSVDLRHRAGMLELLDPAGSVFLGCELKPASAQLLSHGGALIFPEIPGIPFDMYRPELYSGPELFAGIPTKGYEQTPDARIYAWSHHRLGAGAHDSLNAALATTLHDHAIGSALESALESGALSENPVVGLMGGHAQERGTAGFRNAALLGRALARAGFTVATGGGPGAMEAANLGAYLSAHPDAALDSALGQLAGAPSFTPSVTVWARLAMDVLARFPGGAVNLGIPTWSYGHEPPNLFATHIAKYFANAIREAVLLEKCTGGIVFMPGAAGTVQEVFQDACENYYGVPGTITPMVLVGVEHWTRTLPAWPLLRALAAGRGLEAHIHLVDDAAEAVAVISREAGR